MPALFELYRKRRLPPVTRIVGVSRSSFPKESWRESLRESTQAFDESKAGNSKFDRAVWDRFAENVSYFPCDITQPEHFEKLASYLDAMEERKPSSRLFYLATHPSLYVSAATGLATSGAAKEIGDGGTRRFIVEKPFGVDLQSAQTLNREFHSVFREDQIYRIDHYLGKESVQNMLALRFANSIFEPIWNRNYIDHVQITVAESVTVGSRGGYYDRSGVVRDMVQNHLLQLMMITAMEAPSQYRPELVRNEKAKVLQSVRQLTPSDVKRDSICGQYDGYTEEKNVTDDSRTATFAALKLHVDNWRWQGVPFYLRSGKAMSCRTTQIVIQFRRPPHMLFSQNPESQVEGNRLIVQIQPAEGIQLHFETKVPDAGMQLRLSDLSFSFQRQFAEELPDAYQRLLLDAISGDPSLFARSDEVELAWKIIDPVVANWADDARQKPLTYEQGFWGPSECSEWMRQQGREWFDVCPVLN